MYSREENDLITPNTRCLVDGMRVSTREEGVIPLCRRLPYVIKPGTLSNGYPLEILLPESWETIAFYTADASL